MPFAPIFERLRSGHGPRHRADPFSAACASCSDRTPIPPAFIASIPCTVVMHGMPFATAAERISYPSMRGPELPYGVLMIISTAPAMITSMMVSPPS